MKTMLTLLGLITINVGYSQTNTALKVTYGNFYQGKNQQLYSILTAFKDKSIFETHSNYKSTTEMSTKDGPKNTEITELPQNYVYIYTDFTKNISVSNEYVGSLSNRFTVTDTVNIVWHLLTDQKKIDDIQCEKAETVFKGRKYIAWYAKAIPLGVGPWKLSGLPGLVMEVSEIGSPYLTKALKIEWLQNAKEIALPANKYKSITWATYKKLWIEWKTKLQKSMNTSSDPSMVIEGKIEIDLPEKTIFQ